VGGWLVRNKKLEYHLYHCYGWTEFTTKEAEDLYIGFISKPPVPSARWSDTYWTRMSARNALCGAVKSGRIVRVKRGVYKFNKETTDG